MDNKKTNNTMSEQQSLTEEVVKNAVHSAINRQWKSILAVATAVAGTGAAVYALALPSILDTARVKWSEDDARIERVIMDRVANNYATLSARLDDVRRQQERNSTILDRLLEKIK